MNRRDLGKNVFFVLLAILALVLRLIPHSPNFAPIGALFLVAGKYFPGRFSLFISFLVMFLSDWLIGFYEIKLMIAVYVGFLIYLMLGRFSLKSEKAPSLLLFSLAGSVSFFLMTNFAVWALTPWYPKDGQGLLTSYILALPFFKNTLMSDLFYSFGFYGLYQLFFNWRPVTLEAKLLKPDFSRL